MRDRLYQSLLQRESTVSNGLREALFGAEEVNSLAAQLQATESARADLELARGQLLAAVDEKESQLENAGIEQQELRYLQYSVETQTKKNLGSSKFQLSRLIIWSGF